MATRFVCLICRNPIPAPGAECPHCKARSSTAVGATPQLLTTVFAVMIVFFVATGYYNRAFNREREQRATEHFRLARTFADYGYFDEAIEQYRNALVNRRNDFEYRLGLALALYYSDRYQEAELQLSQLRSADPTNAVVNRLLARLALRAGKTTEAINSYRTAIYGRWTQNPEENRVETRFELIDMLEDHGENLQVIGELLSLLREEPANDRVVRRVGMEFLAAGAPGEALRALDRLSPEDQKDAAVQAAIGRALYDLDRFGEARVRFRQSLELQPNEDVQRLYELTDRIVLLDPTYRPVTRSEPRVTTRERYQRSRQVLERTLEYIDYCIDPQGGGLVGPQKPLPREISDALEQSREALDSKKRPDDYNEAMEANLSLAAALWNFKPQVCVNIWKEDEPLSQVLQMIAR